METPIAFGGALKALDDTGRFEGQLVVFGSPEAHDLSDERDYFTAETDYGRHYKSGLDLLYGHALPTIAGEPNHMAEHDFEPVAVKQDDAAIWIEGQMRLRDRYEAKVFDLIKKGKLGLSSGSTPHMVRREKQPNGAHKVVKWPIAEASLTPTPADWRTYTQAIKSAEWLMSPDAREHGFGDLPETWLESCLRTASGLEASLRRFPNIGPDKLSAAKSLRDSLDAIVAAHTPKPPVDFEERRRKVAELLTKLGASGNVGSNQDDRAMAR